MQLINQSMEHSDSYPFGHVHSLQSISYAKRIVNAVERNCVPRERCIEFLENMERVTADGSLRNEIAELVRVRKRKGPPDSYDNKPATMR